VILDFSKKSLGPNILNSEILHCLAGHQLKIKYEVLAGPCITWYL